MGFLLPRRRVWDGDPCTAAAQGGLGRGGLALAAILPCCPYQQLLQVGDNKAGLIPECPHAEPRCLTGLFSLSRNFRARACGDATAQKWFELLSSQGRTSPCLSGQNTRVVLHRHLPAMLRPAVPPASSSARSRQSGAANEHELSATRAGSARELHAESGWMTAGAFFSFSAYSDSCHREND